MIAGETFGKCNVPRYVEYADNIHSSGMHLLSLINDILDLSKLESGKETLYLEPVDLETVISEATTFVANDARKAQVKLRIDVRLDGRLVVADRRAMRQVILNLLSNSIKFTPAGGQVTIAAEPCQDGRILLRVADTGCGIGESEISKVCEPYERAGTAYVRSTSGTGLGLPIVKRLIEIQNGEFQIASKIGAGTTVQAVFAGVPPAAASG
jgi:two-component system cell cycle sensor histidine kinase PleC